MISKFDPSEHPAIMRKVEFARLLGITPGALTQAIKSGSVSVTRDKKINLRNVKNIRYANDCRARKEKTAKGQSEESKKNPKYETAKAAYRQAQELDPELDGPIKADYQIAKLEAQTRKLQISNARDLKMLLDRKFVDNVIGRIASVIANHMLTMGDRISADCAAVCGALTPENKIAVKQLIDKDTTRSINALKSEIQKEYAERVDLDV